MSQLFISDLHLSPDRPPIVSLFLDFLVGPARKAKALYILGDLFEYWAGDDDLAEPFNRRITDALAQCSAGGTLLYFMRGNRDFLVGADFARACGLTLLEEPTGVELADGAAMLSHGDALCTDDADYQAFRAEIRSEEWSASFLARPLDERKREIEAMRSRSEAEKRVKPAAIMDVNETAVANFFREHDCGRLIHGHTHRPARHEHRVNGRHCERWVLADWYDKGSYLVSDHAGLRALPWLGA
ncbi:MAG: UDP-2,3-diacylglucosamine diphosphatase [Betaproteobacteria bacterium RIFCSPLOWO2_02_FULL_62_17]|nr:MAG: UDP-2,3-diacylglucosamine diphosphatase [Betaproteobacteria bacterium RIFCSPLOWO2_02_FULL_62_17]